MEGDVSGVPVDDVEEPQRDPICGMSFINYPRNITGGKRNYSNGSLTRASHSSDSNCYKTIERCYQPTTQQDYRFGRMLMTLVVVSV